MFDNNLSTLNNTTLASVTVLLRKYPITYYFVPFYAILFLFGTFGNGLVFISMLRSYRLRTVTNTYLLNIAVADFLLLLSIPFLIVTILANGWIFGHVLCKMYYNFIHINQYVSSLLLAALSFDRYLAVCRPIQAIEFRTRTKCVLIIGGCWLISVLFLCPTWVFATVTSERYVVWYGYQVQKCVIDFPSIFFTIPPELVFTYYAFLLGFLVPVSMITTFYILVLVRLHNIRRKHRSELKERSHRKVTRVVLAVITAYFICWVPYWFLQIFITIDPLIQSLRLNISILPANRNMRFLKELTHLTTIIGYANNCLNPVLYVFLSDSFREEYLLVLNCFNFRRANHQTSKPDDNIQLSELKSTKKERKSFALRKQREIAMKKVKHSVAMDDIPIEYRTFSFCFHSSNDQNRFSNSSISSRVVHKTSVHSNVSYKLPQSQPKYVNDPLNHSSRKTFIPKITTNSVPQSTPIMDDGGVYCGD
ncbi:unnamed protein product [Rotaria socialis]|uniref:G-protein coupled receptors family 1 profile domain-containing protein n=1 Tax=Rotaria socialis TaxID=392032 RepID=A0A818TTU1_9BILA|nr:unnamed protein product [Rotaria socialis]CAF3424987.1 unnamed protein product [Rotaria socialis]CAF3569583.1 unnamed protein product [Rotaria socialis]CAF3691337.1 unnamed protein product [Rotaria socialis]CAF4114222.1 unnamed protein product [Rotaria socialis]